MNSARKKSVAAIVLTIALFVLCALSFTACSLSTRYTLNFVYDGKTIFTVKTWGDEVVTMPNEPAKAGYVFDGWYFDDETFTQPFTEDTLVSDPITQSTSVYAKMSIAPYTITYVLDGGTTDNPTGYSLDDGEITLNDATKPGYTFIGWYDGDTLVTTISAQSGKNYVLTAKWQKVTYTITYVGTKDADNTNPISYTAEDTITLEPLQAEGYVFSGWENESGEVVTSIESGTSGNRTFTATWKAISYSITYVNIENATNNNPETYTADDGAVTLQNAVKAGNVFGGWYLDEALTESVTEIVISDSLSDLTLYAKWTEIYTRVDESGSESQSGKYVLFGSYPQSAVDESLSAALSLAAFGGDESKLPSATSANGWTDYGYYQGGEVSSYMWYLDYEYLGESYRAVYFTAYRPERTRLSSSVDNSRQDDNGYSVNTVYWFKYEPIRWRIVTEDDGYYLLLAELVLDAQNYSNSTSDTSENGTVTTYANNYAESAVRSFLNDLFYKTAFTELQQTYIKTTAVDNSTLSMTDAAGTITANEKYAAETTNDKVFLLSINEASSYGFAGYSENDTLRSKKATDYAFCQGALSLTDSGYEDGTIWWLRSPYAKINATAYVVYASGAASSDYYVNDTFGGVVPAIRLQIDVEAAE